ncbi:MAG TPA: four helix bundle protein [Algoriphagus sp.]|jgi:four helix bundle protein|uniref:four helix bundle protein n=1 Tax=unclassified Algoriphagus TaxID=2641541 RepID=UPI000C4DC81F|nr:MULTISPECIES: four helix bundle protein [unclassified Algoriphagus]MAL13413.1 four helix bundle protein [Algoriphagus sp.]MAN87984.1 four helix bundle protein [Algoriphagus sp.]HAD52628.1 four helix bundle protein [Algoriphagus sp.]HAH38445.1 four helix bundle protein [Algoriphagus sp.]HAS58992.1 four helix bundle protein [Algoriphagus sp.]|tara:strand:- start:324 stop:737 length:414 start_codon:yes stop_codon:yes gene_type:complete
MENRFFTYQFEKLQVYQLSRVFRVEIKKLTLGFPSDEKFELTSQIRRSSSSIATNLAEGSGRSSYNDQAHFTNISFSSALETIDHLIYAFDMGYISDDVYVSFRKKLDEIINKLNALYKFQINKTEGLKSKLKNTED